MSRLEGAWPRPFARGPRVRWSPQATSANGQTGASSGEATHHAGRSGRGPVGTRLPEPGTPALPVGQRCPTPGQSTACVPLLRVPTGHIGVTAVSPQLPPLPRVLRLLFGCVRLVLRGVAGAKAVPRGMAAQSLV